MDLSCIILSGDLELYVLGMLPEDEAYKIEQLASMFPEVREELDRISESLEGFASSAAAVPSPKVKEQLMDKLRSMKEAEGAASSEPALLSVAYNRDREEEHRVPVVPIEKGKTRSPLLVAASLIGIVIALGIIGYLVSKNNERKSELASLQKQVNQLNANLTTQQQQLQSYNQTLAVLQDDNFQRINLKNVPGKPDALAQVFWNKATKDVYIADVSLPQTPANKQYQLWAIVDGKPVDAGLLENEKNLVQKMKAFEKADAFAITLENKGGSPTPTLEEMYVMAKVS